MDPIVAPGTAQEGGTQSHDHVVRVEGGESRRTSSEAEERPTKRAKPNEDNPHTGTEKGTAAAPREKVPGVALIKEECVTKGHHFSTEAYAHTN